MERENLCYNHSELRCGWVIRKPEDKPVVCQFYVAGPYNEFDVKPDCAHLAGDRKGCNCHDARLNRMTEDVLNG